MRTLPQVTGPTERALEALLERELAASRIPGYLGWVAMNLAHAAATSATLEARLAQTTRCRPEDANAVISELVALGLLVGNGALTAAGAAELASVRERVSATTSAVVAGLADDDLATTIRVLDHVRGQAESLLRE